MYKRAQKASKSNKKVINATKVTIDGIKFRSKLEAYTYRRFKQEGFNFRYEEVTYTILEKFEYMGEKIRAIKRIPDFIDSDNKIIIEVKGHATPEYLLKQKLFKHYLMINNLNFTLYTVKNQGQVEELIKELKIKYNEGS